MRQSLASLRFPVAGLCALALAACGTSEGQIPEDATIPAVEAVQARYGALPLRERLTGTVRASGQVTIFPEAGGPVIEVLARNGDAVRAGDPLVRIRAESSRSQFQQSEASVASARAARQRAQANVDDLERRFERSKPLAEGNYISQEEFETLRSDLEVARATLAQTEAQVGAAEASLDQSRESVRQTVVRAPIDGTVGRRNVEVGMVVTPSTPLFTIGRLDRMEIDVPITQEMLAQVRVGQTAEIRAESMPDTVIAAEVSRVSPFIEPGSFSAELQIDVENPGADLMPGMFVTVDVLYGESEQATLLPKSAIYEDPGTGAVGVFAAPSVGLELPAPPAGADEETAALLPPTLTEFKRIEVLAEGRHVVGVSGVEPGAWVIVVGQHLLSSQDPTAGPPRARIRPVSWERLLTLQGLQREDLLRQFMEKQQRIARGELDPSGAGPRADTSAGDSAAVGGGN